MNIIAALFGCMKALAGRPDWTDHFDLSRKGLQQSFIALLLIIPAFYVIAHAVQLQRAAMFEIELSAVPLAPFAIIVLLYLLCFSAVAYIFAMIFDKQDRFRPWVIARHWSVFWLVLIVAGIFGLNLIGAVPFAAANYIALLGFLCILLIDIRLAQTLIPFPIGAAILIGCCINAMGLVVILLGFQQMI
ncbi:hypothetical protein [Hellea balneolensis]|uniref:hypothetical protein n=1 Tax=Hellea balneolensis TaxID=287478 RepID=UPI000404D1C4|nr:hypothetical protein [Hellea balneolensis]